MLKRRLIPKLQLKARHLGGSERMVLVTTVLALLVYLVLDLVYALVDPRIRYR